MHKYLRLYRDSATARTKPGELCPGKVDPVYFRLLMAIVSPRSDAMINALQGVLVQGLSRKRVCEVYGVNASNLSVSLSRLQVVSQTIARMYPCQFDRTDCPVSRHRIMTKTCPTGTAVLSREQK